MNDETHDYGLDPGESFDPFEDEEIDRSQPHIMTVLGPIHPAALGPVNLAASFVPRSERDDIGAILTEIQECAAVGLNALVDLRPIRNRQEAEAALWLAQQCDIHLIVAAGAGENPAVAVAQAESGFFDSPVLPGLIVAGPLEQEIASGQEGRTVTGLPLVIDARFAAEAPLPASDGIAIALRSAALATGASRLGTILLDVAEMRAETPLTPSESSSVNHPRWLVGYDPQEKGRALFSRWSWLIEEFPIDLLEARFELSDVRDLLIDAPATFLTIDQSAFSHT